MFKKRWIINNQTTSYVNRVNKQNQYCNLTNVSSNSFKQFDSLLSPAPSFTPSTFPPLSVGALVLVKVDEPNDALLDMRDEDDNEDEDEECGLLCFCWWLYIAAEKIFKI